MVPIHNDTLYYLTLLMQSVVTLCLLYFNYYPDVRNDKIYNFKHEGKILCTFYK